MKKFISNLTIGAVVLTGMAQGTTAFAATTVQSNGQVTSDATVKVTEGAAVPTKPEEPNDPSGETGQNGPLSIDQVITFDFQDMKLSGSTQRIDLKSTTPQNIQVTDTRGTGAGWNLQMKQSELTDTTDNTKVLKGAYIAMKQAFVTPGKDNINVDKAPVMENYQAQAGDKMNFQKLSTADTGNGMGTWKLFYNQANTQDIQLVVPSGNLIGSYQGIVTWSLSDSPTASPAN